jgi:hypothetical protein
MRKGGGGAGEGRGVSECSLVVGAEKFGGKLPFFGGGGGGSERNTDKRHGWREFLCILAGTKRLEPRELHVRDWDLNLKIADLESRPHSFTLVNFSEQVKRNPDLKISGLV